MAIEVNASGSSYQFAESTGVASDLAGRAGCDSSKACSYAADNPRMTARTWQRRSTERITLAQIGDDRRELAGRREQNACLGAAPLQAAPAPGSTGFGLFLANATGYTELTQN